MKKYVAKLYVSSIIQYILGIIAGLVFLYFINDKELSLDIIISNIPLLLLLIAIDIIFSLLRNQKNI